MNLKHTVQVRAGRYNAELNHKNIVRSDKTILVYYGHVEQFLDKLSYYQSLLNNYERQRAEKFVFEKDRQLYIVSHGLLKTYMADHLDLPVNQVKIKFINNQKPYLIGKSGLDFNLSHSRDVFAFAISNSPNCKVGIDIEMPKTGFDFQSIIENYMHRDEIAFIRDATIQEPQQKNRFYEIWTRKEAFLKMCGIGIVTNLPEINTSKGTHNISLEAPDFMDIIPSSSVIETLKTKDYPISVAHSSNVPVSIQIQKI